MVAVLLSLLGGILHGVLLAALRCEKSLHRFDRLLLPSLFTFLFFVGYSVGCDAKVIAKFGSLGFNATILALSGIIGSLATAPLAKRIILSNKRLSFMISERRISRKTGAPLAGLRSSASILISFVVGLALGAKSPFGASSCTISALTVWSLYLLMWVAGVTTGGDRSAMKTLKATHPLTLVVPLLIMVGTLAGTGIVSHVLPNVSASQAMGVGAGMGYYSLSCALITNKVGPMLGVTALLVNLIREVVTIGMAPLIVRFFGPFGLLAVGATTTATSSLASVSICAGRIYIFLAVINGLVLTVAVPFLITMILQLGT